MSQFENGDACWAIIRGFGKWPAKVVEKIDVKKYTIECFPLGTEKPLSVAATKLAPLREDECNDKVENDALKVAMDGAKEYLKSRPAILEAVPTVEHQPAPRTTPGNSSDEEFELELEAPADNKWTIPPRSIVWAKSGKWPYWPGHVIGERASKRHKGKREIKIKWLCWDKKGTGEWMWVALNNIDKVMNPANIEKRYKESLALLEKDADVSKTHQRLLELFRPAKDVVPRELLKRVASMSTPRAPKRMRVERTITETTHETSVETVPSSEVPPEVRSAGWQQTEIQTQSQTLTAQLPAETADDSMSAAEDDLAEISDSDEEYEEEVPEFVEHLEEDLKAVKPELAKLFTAKGRSRREGRDAATKKIREKDNLGYYGPLSSHHKAVREWLENTFKDKISEHCKGNFFNEADFISDVLRPELIIRIVMRRKALRYNEAQRYFWDRKWQEGHDPSMDEETLETAAALIDQL